MKGGKKMMGITSIMAVLGVTLIILLLRACPSAGAVGEAERESVPTVATSGTGKDDGQADATSQAGGDEGKSAEEKEAEAKEQVESEDADSKDMQSVSSSGSGTGSSRSSSSSGSPSSSGGSSSSRSSGSSSGSSSPSGSSSGSRPTTPAKRTCSTCGGTGTAATGSRTVTDSAAWDEQVLVSGAWDEWVVDQAAWDEQVIDYWYYLVSDGHICYSDDDLDDYLFNDDHFDLSYRSEPHYTTVHHDEVGHTVHHDAVYETVHHPAVTHTETTYGTCPTCGGSGQI